MLNRETFREMIIEEFHNQLPMGYSLEVKESIKGNDTKMTGINIMKEGCSGGCVVYAENLYEAYRNGSTVEEITKNTLSEVLDSDIYSINGNSFTKEDILSHSSYRMANKYTNQLRLADVPTRDVPGMTDIVIYPVYEVNLIGHNGNILLTKSMLEANDISVEEIHVAAEANTERRMAIVPLEERLSSMLDGCDAPVDLGSPFLVSCDRESLGGDEASVLGAPKVLASLKQSMYVIPSSTHELLFLPKDMEADPAKLMRLVGEVNADILRPEEVLSNNVYEINEGRFLTYEAGMAAGKSMVME